MKIHIILFLILSMSSLNGCVSNSTPPTLNEAALRNNIAHQFSQHEEMTQVTPNDFQIEARQAVQIGTNTYYAVKIGLTEARNNVSLAFPLTFVTDPTGSLLLNSVIDLKKGQEAILSQAPEVTRLQFPASISPSTFITGNGHADVIFVADPFCPYCRKGYSFLSTHLDAIKTLRMAHNPLTPSNGSAVAAWVMEYALDNNIQPANVMEFSFNELKPVHSHDENGNRLSPEENSINILIQFQNRFPQLFAPAEGSLSAAYEMLIKKYAKKQIETHITLKKAGFISSPIFIINGHTIKGMSEGSLTNALAGTTKNTHEGGICSDKDSTKCSH